MQRRGSLTLIALAGCLAAALPSIAWAGCGCANPAPPRATIRPLVAGPPQPVPLFNPALRDGAPYDVAFEPQGGPQQWTQARTERRKDIADGEMREHLPVVLPDLPLGPCRVSVWHDGAPVFEVAAEDFTVVARPIALHDAPETTSSGYR